MISSTPRNTAQTTARTIRARWRVASSGHALVGVAVAVVLALASATPAGAAGPVTATGVSLSTSASCANGDIEVTYDARGVERQNVQFTAEGGATLDQFEHAAFDPHLHGKEYILTDAANPPATGTVVAVHVTVGTTPPSAATTAEFFVLYRCGGAGGSSTVLDSCFGDYGSCPATADEGLARLAAASTTTSSTGSTTSPSTTAAVTPTAELPAAPVAVGVAGNPNFTG